jgi:hypothetical protein
MPNGVRLIQVANKPLRDSITFGDGKSPENGGAFSSAHKASDLCHEREGRSLLTTLGGVPPADKLYHKASR